MLQLGSIVGIFGNTAAQMWNAVIMWQYVTVILRLEMSAAGKFDITRPWSPVSLFYCLIISYAPNVL